MTQAGDAYIPKSSDPLWDAFSDEEYRYAYAEDFLNTWIASQIITLREQRGLSQSQLGELIGTKQPGVSRLENVNHSTWKTETLKRIARALGVRLKISFETFGSLLAEDASFTRQSIQRPTYEEERQGAKELLHAKKPRRKLHRSFRAARRKTRNVANAPSLIKMPNRRDYSFYGDRRNELGGGMANAGL